MRKSLLAMVVSVAVAGCGALSPTPSATTGWLFQVGSPSLVHVPMIASQGTTGVQTTHFGTAPAGTATSQPAASTPTPAPPMPVVPVPKPAVQGAGGCQACSEQ